MFKETQDELNNREWYEETARLLRLPICIRSYIGSSWADISTTRLPNSYRVRGHTSYSRDSPKFMNSDTQLPYGFVQIWWICSHASHLQDCTQLYEVLFNIMNKLNSWYCLLCVYNTIISSFGIVLWIDKMIQICSIKALWFKPWKYMIELQGQNV